MVVKQHATLCTTSCFVWLWRRPKLQARIASRARRQRLARLTMLHVLLSLHALVQSLPGSPNRHMGK